MPRHDDGTIDLQEASNRHCYQNTDLKDLRTNA